MIYLDNNATTRPSPGVVHAMTHALAEAWPNPSSVHRGGQEARRLVELARRDVAALIGAKVREIVFTSGGTEAIDLAIRGVLAGASARTLKGGMAPIVVSTRIEHAAVRDLLEDLEKRGEVVVRRAPTDREGIVDPGTLAPLLDGAALATIQWANNETGAIQPVAAIGALCRARKVVFHCDGTQWVGKMESDGGGTEGSDEATERRSDGGVGRDPHEGAQYGGEATRHRRGEMAEAVEAALFPSSLRRSVASSLRLSSSAAPSLDLLSFSPHKFHGPKGVGVLWIRPGVRLRPQVHGTQEGGRRGGTENVPGIAGAGAACREAREWLEHEGERERLAALRDHFEQEVLVAIPSAVVNGPRDPAGTPIRAWRRLWNTSNIGFPRLEAEALLLLLSERGLCASAGAACSSGSLDPSPVLLAMGVPPEVAHGSLRFSLSKETTTSEIEEAVRLIVESVEQLRRSSGESIGPLASPAPSP